MSNRRSFNAKQQEWPNVLPMINRRLPRGMIAEVLPGHSEVGGFDLVIWRDGRREDGLMFTGLPDLRAVRQHIKIAVEASHER